MIRSSFIVLPPQELRRLGSLVSVTNRDLIFSGDPHSPFRDDAPISNGYRRNILGWLTGEGTGQGTTWHSRFSLGAATLGWFEDKTLAIVNEQMLTNRLRALGCEIVDATWLATQLHARPGRSIDVIPDWREQVTGRDTDPAPAALLGVM